MKVVGELQAPVAIAVGMFDGFHLGHQALIDNIRKSHMPSMVFTFNTKPAAQDLIYTREEKQSIAAELGVEYYYEQVFDSQFKSLSPHAFVELLQKQFGMAHLTVGYDFHFGRCAQGNVDTLREMQQMYGFTLGVVPEVVLDGAKVSSSRIRQLVRTGDMQEARRLLGRYYFVDGAIESGMRIGGSIGFPTANLSSGKLLPAYGVYATIVKTGDVERAAVTNVGVKPTVKDDGVPNIETYILDFEGNLYGEAMRVCFVQKLRDERKFGSIEEMRAQIKKDSEQAKRALCTEAS